MRCHNCGFTNDADAEFCQNCGTALARACANCGAPLDKGTLLLGLPDDLTVSIASVADRATIKHLAVGDWLTVIYWDDPNERLAQQDFQIIKLAPGIAILADPERIINSGVSGGGAYLAGKLVGNTWRITTDTNDRPLGRFTIALVPPQIVE
jgi:hypothetical protein